MDVRVEGAAQSGGPGPGLRYAVRFSDLPPGFDYFRVVASISVRTLAVVSSYFFTLVPSYSQPYDPPP